MHEEAKGACPIAMGYSTKGRINSHARVQEEDKAPPGANLSPWASQMIYSSLCGFVPMHGRIFELPFSAGPVLPSATLMYQN